MDITTEFLFGRSLNILSGANPELQNIADTLDAAEDLMGQRARCGFFYPLVGTRRLEHLAKVLHGFVDSCIKDAAADIATKTHNEQQLKAITDEQRQSTYNKLLDEVVVYDLLTRTSDLKQIRVNLMALIVAGRDSLAASVSMFFYAVSRQPAIWEKLQEEVITTFGAHGIPEMSEIRRLKYLKQVYDESRLSLSLYRVPRTKH
jgi:cytochrome P450